MSNVFRVEREIGGRILSIETGKIARQADGAVIVQYGETVVIASAVTAPPRYEDIDFFPLSVDYRERHSAAGKFPGGFIKREGRPSTKEILTARMTDRPIRPLFPDGYKQEVQIISSVLSADSENDPDILAMIGASAALTISKIPFQGPLGACRLGRIDGKFVINPTYEQLKDGDLNLLLGGRKEAINMIEIGSKQLSEEVIAEAVATAHETVGVVCDMIEELREKAGVEKVEFIPPEFDEELYSKIETQAADKLREFKQIKSKSERSEAVKELYNQIYEEYCPSETEEADPAIVKYEKPVIKNMINKLESQVIKKMLVDGVRPDGRDFDCVRDISCEIGLLPRTHGSALFTRGETQSLVSVTL
ncbi:MAG: polyribonucleotide nucleotidyltransferase, partial [Planctomycetota bacterium]